MFAATEHNTNLQTTIYKIKIQKRKRKHIMAKKKPLIGVISLGCDKNRVDTENMLTLLKRAGYNFTADSASADIIIINTCAFIANARKESMETILEMSQFKKIGTCKKLIVTGCMPQKYLHEMQAELPEVDAFLGINEYENIVEIVDNLMNTKQQFVKLDGPEKLLTVSDRMITTPTHYAYLMIADGCNNFCAYCTIPYIRGRYRSRTIEELVVQATELVQGGSQEIILVAQDVTRYGTDVYGEPKLVQLIQELSKIEDLRWIRLLYCYPELVDDALLNEIVTNDKVCKYIDIPFQHVSTSVLKRMNRHITYQEIVALVEKIQALPKHIAIRTTFMVGFPGETNEDFNLLLRFVKKYKLRNVGFFAYSREEGTVAGKMPEQIPEAIKQKRLVKLVKEQKRNVLQTNRKLIGKELDVVYEGIDYEQELFFGRTQRQAPEIDTLVYFSSKTPVDIGEMYKIKIKKVKDYDIKGEKIDEFAE